jgi:hypothetical protein
MPRRQPNQQLDLLETVAAPPAPNPSPLYTRTLLPGFMVFLKTTVRGGVAYNKKVIKAEHRIASGVEKASWKTERTISKPDEYKKAKQVRMRARMCVVNQCAISTFGLFCPENNLAKLELAVKEAERMAATFNRSAQNSHVHVYVVTGRIAQDGVQAAKAINSEVRELLAAMAAGIKGLNAKAVRDAAARARNIGSMLAPDAASKLRGAIERARSAARKIVKAGEETAQEIDRESIKAITEARTAFLDIEEGEAAEVQSPDAEGRAIDLDPAVEAPAEASLTGRAPSEAPARPNRPQKGTARRRPASAEASA